MQNCQKCLEFQQLTWEEKCHFFPIYDHISKKWYKSQNRKCLNNDQILGWGYFMLVFTLPNFLNLLFPDQCFVFLPNCIIH